MLRILDTKLLIDQKEKTLLEGGNIFQEENNTTSILNISLSI